MRGRLEIPDDAADRFMLALSGYVAECGMLRLRRSSGRRMVGRNTRYWLHGTGRDRAPTFTAASDDEAVQKANAWLEKQLQQGKIQDERSDAQRDPADPARQAV